MFAANDGVRVRANANIEGLPAGWTRHRDPKSGKYYYENMEIGGVVLHPTSWLGPVAVAWAAHMALDWLRPVESQDLYSCTGTANVGSEILDLSSIDSRRPLFHLRV